MDNSKLATSVTLEELEIIVARDSKTGDPNYSLNDWINGSDLEGLTIADVIAEWDADQEYIQNCHKV